MRVEPIDAIASMRLAGRFGFSGGYGLVRHGKGRFGFYHVYAGIYQMQTSLQGKFLSKVAFYTPTNPRTTAQQAQRAKYAAAVGAYRALTDLQKASYNKAGNARGMRGYVYFMQIYLRTH